LKHNKYSDVGINLYLM